MENESYAMVVPWMDNGDIVEYVREEPQTNPLKLARSPFHLMQQSIESRHSWRALSLVFNTFTAWI